MEKIVNGNRYEFINSYTRKKDGFSHRTALRKNGELIQTGIVYWSNRTWESFPFATSMNKATKLEMENASPEYKKELEELLWENG